MGELEILHYFFTLLIRQVCPCGAISSQYIASNNFQNIEVKRVQLYKESEMRRCQNSRKGVVPKKKLRLKWCVAADFSITQNMISYDLYAVLF